MPLINKLKFIKNRIGDWHARVKWSKYVLFKNKLKFIKSRVCDWHARINEVNDVKKIEYSKQFAIDEG